MTDALLEYACSRISELESLLLVEILETGWPAEVALVYSLVESAGDLPAHNIFKTNIYLDGDFYLMVVLFLMHCF